MDEIKDACNIAKTAKDVLPETVNQADETLAAVVGFFNNVVLYPVKKLNMKFQYKAEQFKKDFYKRTDKIPTNCIKEPDVKIIGPALESLKYTIDDECLREMYLNLLASSVDARKTDIVHPSYVEIIKQMDSNDAKLFSYLTESPSYIKAINPKIHIIGTDRVYVNSLPQWFIDYPDKGMDIFVISASLCRLGTFGLIDLMFDRTQQDHNGQYMVLEKSKSLTNILTEFQIKLNNEQLDIKSTHSLVMVNDFGRQFAQTCLPRYQ